MSDVKPFKAWADDRISGGSSMLCVSAADYEAVKEERDHLQKDVWRLDRDVHEYRHGRYEAELREVTLRAALERIAVGLPTFDSQDIAREALRGERDNQKPSTAARDNNPSCTWPKCRCSRGEMEKCWRAQGETDWEIQNRDRSHP